MCIAAVGAGLLWKWTQEELQVLGWAGGAQPKAEDNHPAVTVVMPPVRPWQVSALYLSVGWQFLQEAIKVTSLLGYSHFPGPWQHRVCSSTPHASQPFPFPSAEGCFSWGTWANRSKIRGRGASRATLLLGSLLAQKADPHTAPQAGLALHKVQFCLAPKFTREDRVRVAAGKEETGARVPGPS